MSRLSARRGVDGATGETLIDTRVLGKPGMFHGKASEWRDWSFVFAMFCRAVNPALATAMELYAHRERADTLAEPDAPTRRLSETLAYMLILMTKDTALEKARNAPEPAHGLETWRLFNKE